MIDTSVAPLMVPTLLIYILCRIWSLLKSRVNVNVEIHMDSLRQ